MEKIICAECNSVLLNENDKCNKCGSSKKIICIHFEDSMPEMRDIFCLKAKDKTKNSKRNPVLDVFQGNQMQKSTGKWINKIREIDKINNRYYEHIETLDGKKLHHCDEKLTDHKGHGNAKTKMKK